MPANERIIASLQASDPRLSRVQAWALFVAVTELMGQALVDGEAVKITGFGSFRVCMRSARVGRDPRTGAPKVFAPWREVCFRASKALKATLNRPTPYLSGAHRGPGAAGAAASGGDFS